MLAHRVLLTLAFLFAALVLTPVARAAPSGGSASGQISTQKGASGSSSASDFEFPEMVVAGNALSFLAPVQIGIVKYLPRARFAFQYDRQIRRAHWIFFGVGLVADRASWRNFRMDRCGLENPDGSIPMGACEPGGVVGFDLYGGYAHKFYLREHPYLVPIVRGAVGFSWWALPRIGGDREQSRTKSWTLNLRPGGGLRLFLLEQLGIGFDLNLPLGFLIHTDKPPSQPEDKEAEFLLGIEILPLIVEYRF